MNTPLIRSDLFALTAIPFLKPPKEPFLDDPRRQHLAQLTKFLHPRGFAAVAGQPGSGKTALVRYLADTLHPAAHKIVYLPFLKLSEADVLKALCQRLDLDPPYGKINRINALQKRLHDLQPVNPVIILDEMQNASPALMELIRLLANHHFDTHCHLSCILIGASEFFAQLRLTINLALAQRITCFCLLRHLSPDHTRLYISHCLHHAGADHPLFEPPALQLIADASKGSPRLINHLAATAMAIASEVPTATVTLAHLQQAADSCLLPLPEVSR